jgi:hypothetical protein
VKLRNGNKLGLRKTPLIAAAHVRDVTLCGIMPSRRASRKSIDEDLATSFTDSLRCQIALPLPANREFTKLE